MYHFLLFWPDVRVALKDYRRIPSVMFGGSLALLEPDVELELGTLDDEADNVAVSVVISSTSLVNSLDKSSDNSSRDVRNLALEC
jgi:hypothetical protein